MEILLLIVSIVAGAIGAILGLGGGVILVPTLTLLFDVPISSAVIVSLLAITATSSGAAVPFLKKGLTNIRVAGVLELGTISGAILGVFVASVLKSRWLFLFFGLFLIFSALQQLWQRTEKLAQKNHPLAERLKMNGLQLGQPYYVERVVPAFIIMLVAGIISAVLGIGAGIFKVLAMDKAMKLPIKVSSATSSLMIGMTAAASVIYYLIAGRIDFSLAVPVSLGALLGAKVGAKLMIRLPAQTIRKIFVVVMLIIGAQMVIRGFNV